MLMEGGFVFSPSYENTNKQSSQLFECGLLDPVKTLNLANGDSEMMAIAGNENGPNKQTGGSEMQENRQWEDGELYVCKKGELEQIQRDPEDNLRKIRITEDAYNEVVRVQRQMRASLNGYKPDITMVCSALLEYVSKSEEVERVIKKYAVKVFEG